MKYKDNNFINYQGKQRNGEVGYYFNKSGRTERRELESSLILFFQMYLLGKVEKEWWLSLSIDDRNSIKSSYQHQEFMLEQDTYNMWSIDEFFDNWDEWFAHIFKKFKPNTSKLRELRMKKIGL